MTPSKPPRRTQSDDPLVFDASRQIDEPLNLCIFSFELSWAQSISDSLTARGHSVYHCTDKSAIEDVLQSGTMSAALVVLRDKSGDLDWVVDLANRIRENQIKISLVVQCAYIDPIDPDVRLRLLQAGVDYVFGDRVEAEEIVTRLYGIMRPMRTPIILRR